MRFSDIIGHHEIKNALRRMADTGRIPHAIMLSGPAGIGKTRLARAFAQYVHCSNRHNGDSCGRCPSCIQHQALNNPDMHYIYPVLRQSNPKRSVSADYVEEWRKMLAEDSYMDSSTWLTLLDAGNSQPAIYVDEADDLNATAALSAFREDYKIFLIWLPERMRPETANKLLKLIEEPFGDTLFILVSNDSGNVLPTIFSRTQRFNLRPLTAAELTDALITEGIDRPVAETAAQLAEGSLINARTVAKTDNDTAEFANLFKGMMRAAYARKLGMLRQLTDQASAMGRERLRSFLTYCARMVRENFICNLHQDTLNLMTPAEREFSIRFAPFIHEGNAPQLLTQFSLAARDIERNANAKIIMFDLGLHLCALIRATKRPPA
ncbi:MAG: AAA family ATPase [Muribaculaceae bacterium]|nr:AAA family ATPase [Muribaculaceae bacterium]